MMMYDEGRFIAHNIRRMRMYDEGRFLAHNIRRMMYNEGLDNMNWDVECVHCAVR